jgi:hypothetical protein
VLNLIIRQLRIHRIYGSGPFLSSAGPRNPRKKSSDVAPTKTYLQSFILIRNKTPRTPRTPQTCLWSPRVTVVLSRKCIGVTQQDTMYNGRQHCYNPPCLQQEADKNHSAMAWMTFLLHREDDPLLGSILNDEQLGDLWVSTKRLSSGWKRS